MFRLNSIITQHFLISLLILVFTVGYVHFGVVFTEEMEDDSETINVVGSLRYRSYKLLALTQQAYNPAFPPASSSLPAKEEITRIRSTFANIRETLLQDAGNHSQLLRQLLTLTVRWENEIVPLANRLMSKQGADFQAQVHFKDMTDVFVRDVDVFVNQVSSHNRSEIRYFNHRRAVIVLAFLPVLILIAYYSKKHLINPIIALQNASQRLMDGDFSVRLSITSRNEVGVLTDLFNQTAVALEDLFASNRNYSKTLDELNRASSEMISMGNRGEIYQFACNTSRELLNLDMVWLGIIEPASSQVKLVACVGDKSNYTAGLVITCDDSPTSNGPVGVAIKSCEPCLACIDDDSFWPWRHLAQHHGYQSILAIPLVTTHDCLGAIVLYSKQPDFFTHEQVELCRIFANHTSAAIEAMNLLHYVVFALARASEVNDEDTGNHILRVGEYCALLAEEMGLDSAFVEQIRFQATLHDVGKLYLDSSILKKPGPLTPEEWKAMRLHTIHGAKIVGEHPMLLLAHDIALWHHERWDGSGYPFGLKGEQIHLSARIISIADQYDALRNVRVYKPAFDHQKSCDIITKGDGRTLPGHFDPEVLAAFTRIAHRFDEIYERLA
jgi:HD-GYP domain-containing protein (c-di-GMP phosphodiesterase class II)/HAMP domain-containing protein